MSVRRQLLVPSSNLLLRRAARQSARAQRVRSARRGRVRVRSACAARGAAECACAARARRGRVRVRSACAARQSARAQRAARQSASAAHELWPFVSVHLHKHLGNADALQESLCDLVIDQIG